MKEEWKTQMWITTQTLTQTTKLFTFRPQIALNFLNKNRNMQTWREVNMVVFEESRSHEQKDLHGNNDCMMLHSIWNPKPIFWIFCSGSPQSLTLSLEAKSWIHQLDGNIRSIHLVVHSFILFSRHLPRQGYCV
jgi:lipopolysaccharide biosynthesis glycosyltransferase